MIWNGTCRGIKASLIILVLLLCTSAYGADNVPQLPSFRYSLQQNPLLASYFPVWKKAFQAINGLEEAEFETHIHPGKIFNYGELRDRDFMTIEYFVTSGWFMSRQLVTFDIMLPAGETSPLQLPRETYLSEEDVARLLHGAGSRVVGKAAVKSPLVFATRELAIEQLKQMVGEAVFTDDKIVMDLVDGQPTLSVTATIDYDQNTCRQGMLNLLSGNFTVTDGACYTVN